ncbi:MAG: efflux RND transporter periplasmic adaptor subunit, partial [Ginsengibacter sp.]
VLSIPINAVTTREKNDSTKAPGANKPASDDMTANTTNADDLDIVVFIVQAEGKVKMQKVKTDIQDINYIEITDGLKEGDEVVTGPYDIVSKTLKSGDKVKIVPKNEIFSVKK